MSQTLTQAGSHDAVSYCCLEPRPTYKQVLPFVIFHQISTSYSLYKRRSALLLTVSIDVTTLLEAQGAIKSSCHWTH